MHFSSVSVGMAAFGTGKVYANMFRDVLRMGRKSRTMYSRGGIDMFKCWGDAVGRSEQLRLRVEC